MNTASECYAAIAGGGANAVAGFLARLARRRGLRHPVRVLDVGCGPGRMFPAFRSLGWSVRAMEPDPAFHEAAVEAARAAGFEVPSRAGFAAIEEQGAYDLLTAINDSFSHLLSGEERVEALSRAFRALRPGGVIFLDVPNFLWILRHYREPPEFRAPSADGDVVLTRRHELDFHAATFTTLEDYRLIRDGREQRVRMRHVYAMTSLPELEHALRTAGFNDIETYGAYTAGAPERIDGPRMLLAAMRPA